MHVNNLAMRLKALGEVADMEPLLRRALESSERTQHGHALEGPAHARRHGFFPQQALVVSDRTLGEEHPSTPKLLNNLVMPG